MVRYSFVIVLKVTVADVSNPLRLNSLLYNIIFTVVNNNYIKLLVLLLSIYSFICKRIIAIHTQCNLMPTCNIHTYV